MSILQEIHKWSQKLPAWQQDAIARLYAERQLGQAEIEQCYALLKAAHGIPDPKNTVPIKLAQEQIAAPAVANRLVQITAIKNLVSVNALAEGQCLAIHPLGLTIVYGENGAGKSGYSRILKKACRARDQREPLLPDARKPGKAPPARAAFDMIVDGNVFEATWAADEGGPAELSDIAIFDAHCARAYVDNQGDFAYAPYGLDILEGLVKLCNRLRAMSVKDRTALTPNVEPFASLGKTPTKVGALVSRLSAQTKPEDIESLGTLSEEEVVRKAALQKTLAEADPKQKAQDLRTRAGLFSNVAERIAKASTAVSAESLGSLKILIEKSNTAKEIARQAAANFAAVPGMLPGTGGEAWKELFEKARAFVAESHPGHVLQSLAPIDQCPLCQNPLGEQGAARLSDFDALIQQEAARAFKAARQSAAQAFETLRGASMDLGLLGTVPKQLEAASAELGSACAAMQESFMQRQAAAVAAAGDGSWDLIPALSKDPSPVLAEIAAKLAAEAKALEDAADQKSRAALATELAELAARERLSELKTHALDCVAKLVLIDKHRKCEEDTGTTAISRQSTTLSTTMATQEVADALNTELKNLNVHELQIVMKPESPGGKTTFKLALQLPGGGAPSAILSEGEQRAIAIASFLAEVRLGKGRGGIVFDDPVSSLDHRRRWEVATRLAEEAKHRQVIVFTHDIYFLCILQQEAASAGIEPTTQCIHRTAKGFGVQTDRLPFDTLATSKRVKALRDKHQRVAALHNAGEDELATLATRDAYVHLREAWERGVEEVLFQGVVVRFREGVSTQALKGVTVDDDDYKTIDAGMTKSSKFSGHDPAQAAHLPRPHPDDLLKDIEALETWRTKTDQRSKALVAARK